MLLGGTCSDTSFKEDKNTKTASTDGRATMPYKKCNIIWVVFGGTKINPVGGKVIYINDEQLKILKLENYNKMKR